MARKIKVSRFTTGTNEPKSPGVKFIYIFLVVALFLGGFAAGRAFTPKTTSATNTTKTSNVGETYSKYGPYDTKSVIPKKFDHSTEGAMAAASTFVSFTPKFYLLSDAAYDLATAQVSTIAYAQTLRTAMDPNRVSARAVFASDENAFYREIPLGYNVVSESKNEVVVQIWSEIMLVAKPAFNGNTESKYHAMRMVWENNDWKIGEWTSGPGPTPRWQSATQLLTVEDFLTAIKPFTGGYDYVPSF